MTEVAGLTAERARLLLFVPHCAFPACPLCGVMFSGFGNNAAPFEGRCCGAIFTLLYADGETYDEVVGVKVEDETIVAGYPQGTARD